MNLDAGTFVLNTNGRGAQTVSVTTSTSITKNGVIATLPDLSTSTKVRVTGTWDQARATVAASSVAASAPLVNTHIHGKVTVDGDGKVTVQGEDGKTYTVDLNKTASFFAQNKRMNKKDIQEGDHLDIWAKGETSSTALSSYLVRDLSQLNKKTQIVSLNDLNSTVQAQVGDWIVLKLGEANVWSGALSSNTDVVALNGSSKMVFGALSVGQSDINVSGEPRCRLSTPACAAPSVTFHVTVNVIAASK